MRSRQAGATALFGAGAWLRVPRLMVACLLGVALSLASCVADPPPVIRTAEAGSGQATVWWSSPPGDNAADLVAYVVTPYINGVAQTPVQFSSTATTQVVTGLTDGTSYTFTVAGINAQGHQTASSAASASVTPALAIGGGFRHSCALVAGGTVKCWGWNQYGQLGNGTMTDSSTPVTVTGITTAVAVTTGAHHSCALLADGTVRCWGWNLVGQLGNGAMTEWGVGESTPVTVVGVIDAVALTGGFWHTCVRRAGGGVQCWGANHDGQLGDGLSEERSPSPVTVSGLTDAATVTAGGHHTCARRVNGTVQCWGYNASGQLGDGTTTSSSVPVTVNGVTNAVALSAGSGEHSCAVLASGTAKCWGWNDEGQLGDGTTTTYSSTPVTVSGLSNTAAITAGFTHSCAKLTGGTVKCWGDNLYGQLGDGTTTDSATAVSVSGLSDAAAMTAGDYHSCVRRVSGSAQCWGYNSTGQLGDATTTNSSTPVTVTGL